MSKAFKILEELREQIKKDFNRCKGVDIALSCADHIDFMLEASRDEMKEEVK